MADCPLLAEIWNDWSAYTLLNLRITAKYLGGDMIKIDGMKDRYGVNYVARPHIKANKKLELAGETGKEVIKVETEKVLKIHKKLLKS